MPIQRRIGKCWRSSSLMILGWMLVFIMPRQLIAAEPDIHSPAFQTSYADYYAALDGYEVSIMKDELSDTIEDGIVTARNFARVLANALVDRFSDGLYACLKAKWCSPDVPVAVSQNEQTVGLCVKEVCLSQSIKMQSESAGRTAAIVVRIIEQVGKGRLCQGSSFESLE